MEPRLQIWNVLHDGEITVVSKAGDTITMFVSIPYLRRRMEPLGDSFVLKLSGVRQAEWHDFSGSEVLPLGDMIEMGGPEILKTESESMPLKIETTLGHLVLDYDTITFSLDTGQSIEYEKIEEACEAYWTEWEAKNS